jgi:hypothetical protein
MNDLIVTAIRGRRRLRFVYHGVERLVEPQCYGRGTRGTELLRGHQLRGGTQKEPLFDVAKMERLVLTDDTFTKPGPNYTKCDSAMATIYCEL